MSHNLERIIGTAHSTAEPGELVDVGYEYGVFRMIAAVHIDIGARLVVVGDGMVAPFGYAPPRLEPCGPALGEP
jgi:hypothetical protein